MDLRVLRYFLTVVQEQSIVGAAEVLHITQPTLSRQLKDLEKEFGAKLFIRGNKTQGLSLTEKGMLLRRRAEELIELADKTQVEMQSDEQEVIGSLSIGGGESDAMRIIAKAANALKKQHPGIHFQLFSGNAEDVKEKLDKGLLDFGVFVEPTDMRKYETIQLPSTDSWGVLTRRDSPIADKESLTPQELLKIPLLISAQNQVAQTFAEWAGINSDDLHIVATYNLLFNASLMVEEGFGNALCLDKIINTIGSELCFIPLKPKENIHLSLAWKKYQMLTKPAEVFLDKMYALCLPEEPEE